MANTAWAFATLAVRDAPLLDAIASAAIKKLIELRAQNLSNTAWAFSALRVPPAPLFSAIAAAARPRITSEFDLQGLANTLWAFSTLPLGDLPLLAAIAAAAIPTISAAAPGLARRPCGAAGAYFEASRYANHLCQLVWGFSFSRHLALGGRLARTLRGALVSGGRRLDGAYPELEGWSAGARALCPCPVRPTTAAAAAAGAGAAADAAGAGAAASRGAGAGREPRLELQLRGIGVVLKPPGWEVDAKGQLSGSGLYLSGFTRAACAPRPSPVLTRSEFEFGFVHRLDVPSSGLILTGLHFEGYSELQWQMHTYSIGREYSVLLAGTVPSTLRVVEATINDFLPGRSFIDGVAGRPAETHVKASLQVQHRWGWVWECFGLACIAIHTGRRHQIRVHVQHAGHPTVTDEKYSHAAVLVSSFALEREVEEALGLSDRLRPLCRI